MAAQFRILDTTMNTFVDHKEFDFHYFSPPAPAPAPAFAPAPMPAFAFAPVAAYGVNFAPAVPCATTVAPCGHPSRPTKGPRAQEQDQLQNVAHMIAAGTSKALEAVTRAGKRPSPFADAAKTHAMAAKDNAKRGADLIPDALKTNREASQMITKLGRIMKKGVQAFAYDISKVQIPPPLIPPVYARPDGLDMTRT